MAFITDSFRSALRHLADSASLLVWMTDTSDNCIFLNHSAAAFFDNAINFTIDDWLSFVHPEDLANQLPKFAQAKQARTEYQLRYRIVRSDGSVRWMLGTGAPRFSDTGEYLSYIGTILDISEQQATLEKLAQSESALRVVTENSLDLISHHEPDTGVFRYASPSVSELLGYDQAELLSASVYDLLYPGDAQLIREEVRLQVEDGRQSTLVQFRIRKKSGSYVWLGTRFKVLKSPATGKYIGVVAISRDITTERQAIAELQNSEERFRSLVALSSDWYWETDQNGHIIFVSPTVARSANLPLEDVIGKALFEPAASTTETGMQDGVGRAKSLEPFRDLSYTALDQASGKTCHVRISGEPVFRDGVFKGYRGIGRDVTESHNAGKALSKSREMLASMLESIGDAFFALGRDWRFIYVNEKTANFVGLTPDDMVGKLVWEAIPEVEGSPLLGHYQRAMASGQPVFFEEYWAPRQAWVEVRAYPNEDGLSVYFHDVTERHESEAVIRNSEQRLRDVIEMTPAGYILTDARANILDVNPALCEIAGYSEEELIGKSMTLLMPDCSCESTLLLKDGLNSEHGRETVLKRKDGTEAHILVSANIKRDSEGNGVSLTAFITDITVRKEAENRLEQLATHDTLTGLPNRSLLNERVQHLLDTDGQKHPVAVLFIDLDRFKEINDSLGHASGDKLLCEIAARLKDTLRPTDIVARLGGDEFVVAAPCSRGQSSATRIVEHLLAAFAAPIDICGHEVFARASIGIAMYPQDGTTKDVLFQNADAAMYSAKGAGRNTYRFFRPEMSEQARVHMTLESSLHRALDRNEFVLYYQPRIDLQTKTIVGMEALIRWRHPQLGQISPLDFIPIAEERGFIEAIGKWVIDTACMESQRLMKKLGRSLHISVNLSAHQVKLQSLISHVRDALSRSGLPPASLELELTEGALIEDMEASIAVFKELKRLGVMLAVDDFGTGYSGLAYLGRFPLDVLKLDRSFIVPMQDESNAVNVVQAFIGMAHSLGLSVVAEGIETQAISEALIAMGCNEGQGYLYSCPLPLDELEHFISRFSDTRPAIGCAHKQ